METFALKSQTDVEPMHDRICLGTTLSIYRTRNPMESTGRGLGNFNSKLSYVSPVFRFSREWTGDTTSIKGPSLSDNAEAARE
jgi:hypothetical protein